MRHKARDSHLHEKKLFRKKMWHTYMVFVIGAPLLGAFFLAAANFNQGMQSKYNDSLKSYVTFKQGDYAINGFCKIYNCASEKERIEKKLNQEYKSQQDNINSLFNSLIVSWSGLDFYYTKKIAKNARVFDNDINARLTICTSKFPTYSELYSRT